MESEGDAPRGGSLNDESSAPSFKNYTVRGHALRLWALVAHEPDLDVDADVADPHRQRSHPFSGHFFAEAGLSFRVPPAILAGICAEFALGMMALAMSIALRSVWERGAFVLLTTAFWCPLLQAVAFLLLAASSMRMQLAYVAQDTPGCARLPDVVVPLHQTASAIAPFSSLRNFHDTSPGG